MRSDGVSCAIFASFSGTSLGVSCQSNSAGVLYHILYGDSVNGPLRIFFFLYLPLWKINIQLGFSTVKMQLPSSDTPRHSFKDSSVFFPTFLPRCFFLVQRKILIFKTLIASRVSCLNLFFLIYLNSHRK